MKRLVSNNQSKRQPAFQQPRDPDRPMRTWQTVIWICAALAVVLALLAWVRLLSD